MPYSFHLVPRTSDAARVQITNSILADALTPPKVSTSKTTIFSPEDVFELWCEPQAVFRVRSVGRCSATLSGESVPDHENNHQSAEYDRPCFTYLVLCAFTNGPICRYWIRRCYLSSMGHGDRDSQGLYLIRVRRCKESNGVLTLAVDTHGTQGLGLVRRMGEY